jgi:hypothetical protein
VQYGFFKYEKKKEEEEKKKAQYKMTLTNILAAITNTDRRTKIHAAVCDILATQQQAFFPDDDASVPILYKDIPQALEYDAESKLHHLLHEKKGAESSGRKHLLTLLHFLIKYSECVASVKQRTSSQRKGTNKERPLSFVYVIMFAHIMTPHIYFIFSCFPDIRVIFVEQERTSLSKCSSVSTNKQSETWHANIKPSQQPWYLSHEQLSKSMRQFVHCSSKSIAYIQTEPSISFLQRMKKILNNLHITQIGVFSDIQMCDTTYPSDADILWCLARQAHFIYFLEPTYSSIKFKLPFQSAKPLSLGVEHGDELDEFKFIFNVDLVEAYKQNVYSYLEGDMYTQPFGAASSTECRILIDMSTPALRAQRLGKLIQYPSTQEYENRMFYFNSIQRVFGKFRDPLKQSISTSSTCSKAETPRREHAKFVCCAANFDGCLSCSLERSIWKLYDKIIAPICIRSAISDLTRVLGQPDVHQTRVVVRMVPCAEKTTTYALS